jgi:hypothetical protein
MLNETKIQYNLLDIFWSLDTFLKENTKTSKNDTTKYQYDKSYNPYSVSIKFERNVITRHRNFCKISYISETDICYPHLLTNTTNRPSIGYVTMRREDHKTLTYISNLQNR